jgi:alpha-beta hydrolase superfamily lysophospholipase
VIASEKVEFFSDGLRIDAVFYPTGESPGPAVVFCPGSRVTKQTPYYHEYIPRLVAGGLSVLLFDYRGWGESEGEIGTLYPVEQVADIRNAVTYLSSRDDVDAGRIGVVGMSMGGALAMAAAAADHRIRATAAVLAPMDGELMLRSARREHEWIALRAELEADERQRVLTGRGSSMPDLAPPTPERTKTSALSQAAIPPIPLACVQAIAEFRPLDVVGRISPRAVLFIAATRDTTCPVEHSRLAYAAAGSPRRLVEIDSAEHYGTYVQYMDLIISEMVDWCDRHLAPEPVHIEES